MAQKGVVDVLAVLKTDGQKIQFDKSRPGVVMKGEVVGWSGKPETIEILKADLLITPKGGFPKVVTTKDHQEILAQRIIKEDKVNVLYERIPQIRIPLTEIDKVYVKKTDGVMSFVATIGLIAGIAAGGLAILALTKESCPFIYSFDGQGYIFDAEPYGGATCPGLERTEWVKLEHLRDVGGVYRIRLTNEVEETQYTDELKLVVVDHDPGVTIAPDENGAIHTFSRPQPPVHAVDGRGRDILPYVARTDWLSWETPASDLDLSTSTTKGDLVFEFPKPEGTIAAKIIFNGCNTLWASQMVKRYLELHGSNIAACYAALNSKGPAYELTKKWYYDEELYQLQIRVETTNGWETRGTFIGGGPFASEDKAYVLDLKGVSGNALRIRLTPPAAFWAINSIAVDYSEDIPVQVQTIAAAEAVDYAGKDVRGVLALTDQTYQVMAETGNWADISFLAPPLRPGLERTILAKASGYYDIHMAAKGAPRMDILSRFLTEPGFGGYYGLQEYLKWKRETAVSEKKK